MTVLHGPTRAFDLDDIDLFDLVGSLRLDRVQLVALLERSRSSPPGGTPEFAVSGLRCSATPTLELRRPIHLLADLLTMLEQSHRPLERISVCSLGDGEADIARSLLLAGTLLGMDVRIGSPASMWPTDASIATAQDLAADSGARLMVTSDAGHAVRNAMYVVVGAWAHGPSLAGSGATPPAYLVTEDFLASTGLPTTKTLVEASVFEFAPVVPRTLQALQSENRRRVMAAALSDWIG